MRLWSDSSQRLMTDEQLLRLIAHFGSLQKATEHGDIVLVDPTTSDVSPDSDDSMVCVHSQPAPKRSLADYL